MRISLEDLMEKLGVDHVMTPYETQPWMHYDEEQGLTCSAEVRMGPAYEDLQTEVQFLHDHGETILPDEDEEEGEEGAGQTGGMMPPAKPKQNPIIDGREQILLMRMIPVGDEKWDVQSLNVKGMEYRNEFHEWDVKGCELFRSIIEALLMGEIPDIDEMAERTLCEDDGFGGGRRGRVGRKSPKVKPGALLGMKKGM